MRFIFKAKFEDGSWVAGWGGETPAAGVIVTESKTREGLDASVKDAIETFLLGTSEEKADFTFEIREE